MTLLKQGSVTTLVLILLSAVVYVAGGPMKPTVTKGPLLTPVKGKDSSDDGIAKHHFSKFFRDMFETSHDLTALESLQKFSEIPPEAVGEGESAWEAAEVEPTLSEGKGQTNSKEGSAGKKEKYVWIATPNWTRSWKAAQRDAAASTGMLITKAGKLPGREEIGKDAFLNPGENVKEGKKEKYVWIATPNWTRSLKTAKKEAASMLPPFTDIKEIIGEEIKEVTPEDVIKQKEEKYVWYAVPDWESSQQVAQKGADDALPSSDNQHHRQKRFIHPYKLRLIAVPVSIFNYLGFLPIKIPGLPYHDDLPPPDYTYYNTVQDLRSHEREKYFF
ncbi:uncharacterized protein [Palaemon carinicauda]|uniref:uncharacterized protein n=1 Tax=Palaemon carinicauda TaxID=392227 RepID=UPI0035B5A09D